jgi:uncharacterized protein YggU (UPF0235/DUF167 family)
MRVTIRVRPGASREYVGGTYGDGAIVVRVCVPAVGGRATEAALRAVASASGVRRSAVHLVSRATSRDKVIDIQGDEEDLAERVTGVRVG